MALIRRLAALEKVETVLVGDGWSVFGDRGDRLCYHPSFLSFLST